MQKEPTRESIVARGPENQSDWILNWGRVEVPNSRTRGRLRGSCNTDSGYVNDGGPILVASICFCGHGKANGACGAAEGLRGGIKGDAGEQVISLPEGAEVCDAP